VVFLDMSNITPGFSGTVAITANGTVSLDGGLTVEPITFAPDQPVTDAEGHVVFLDTSGVRRPGTNWIEFPDSYDIFRALIDLRDDLEGKRSLPASQQSEALSRMIAALDAVHHAVLQALGEQSATLASLETLEQQIQDVKLEFQSRLGQLEEADLAELVVRLQAQQNQLTLLLGATAQVLQVSLLDFLR
jgi:flagellin-like hook-associated protein FlgL